VKKGSTSRTLSFAAGLEKKRERGEKGINAQRQAERDVELERF